MMERLVETVGLCSGFVVPLVALWAITCLYSLRSGCRCCVTEYAYFLAMLAISGVTIRTVIVDDSCWLLHTASLGVMIVAGVMRRPATDSDEVWLGDPV